VTIKERIVVLNVQSNRKSVSHGFLAGIFGTLDRFGVVVDLISTSEVFVSMAIEDVLDRNLQARLVRDLEKIGTVCFLNPPFRPRFFALGLSWQPCVLGAFSI
jgi:aspartate kinase